MPSVLAADVVDMAGQQQSRFLIDNQEGVLRLEHAFHRVYDSRDLPRIDLRIGGIAVSSGT